MSAICGRNVISKSEFQSDPWLYMLCFYMEDDKYEEYLKIKDEKEKRDFFEKYAISAI